MPTEMFLERAPRMELNRARTIAEQLNLPIELGFDRVEVPENVRKRFWSKVMKSTETGQCWIWIGSKDGDGYGRIKVGGRSVKASRVAYEIQIGPIPPKAEVLHSCDRCACVRGAHLFIGVQADNVEDMMRKGRGNKAYGDRNASRLYPEKRPRGETHHFRLHPELHARGERAANAKLKENQVIEIRHSWEARELSQHALARKYEVTLATVNSIVLGKTWRHLL